MAVLQGRTLPMIIIAIGTCNHIRLAAERATLRELEGWQDEVVERSDPATRVRH